MGIVISLADIRNGKAKETLLSYVLEGEAAIIETRIGVISAERMLCRETVVEIFDPAGDYFAVNYSDIRDVRAAAPAAQTSVVNASGEWVVATERMPRTGTGAVLRFPDRMSRG